MKTDKKDNIVIATEQNLTEDKFPIEVIADNIKKANNLSEVYITEISGINIIWRKIKRSEYKESMVQQYSENEELAYLEKQDFIAGKVILYPENVEELLEEYAGVADIIAIETMLKTGFGMPKTTAV